MKGKKEKRSKGNITKNEHVVNMPGFKDNIKYEDRTTRRRRRRQKAKCCDSERASKGNRRWE